MAAPDLSLESCFADESCGDDASPSGDVVPVSTSGDFEQDELLCVACEEKTTYGESWAYGRSLFKRRCKKCTSSYRHIISVISAEKKNLAKLDKKGVVGEQQKHWKGLSKEDRVAWYRRHKRTDLEKGKKREVEPVVHAVRDTRQKQQGRYVYTDLVPWKIFLRDGLKAGNTQTALAVRWRELIQNPSVYREYHVIDGEEQPCVEQFGGIRLYKDDASLVSSTVKQQAEVRSAAELEKAMEQRKGVMQSSSSSSGAMPDCSTVPTGQEDDHEVEEHLLPDKMDEQAFDRTGDWMAGLETALKDVDEARAAIVKDLEAKAKIAHKQHQEKEQRQEQPAERAVIIDAKAKYEQKVRAVTDKTEAYDKSFKQLADDTSTVPRDGESWTAEIDRVVKPLLEEWRKAAETYQAKVKSAIADLDAPQGVSPSAIRSAQKDMVDEMSILISNVGKPLTAALRTMKAKATKELAKRAKESKVAGAITASPLKSTGTAVVQRLLGGTLAHGNTLGDFDLAALQGYKGPFWSKAKQIGQLCQRLARTQYASDQEKFLLKMLKEKNAQSQGNVVALKSIHADLKKSLKGILPDAFSWPPEVTQKTKRPDWTMYFSVQIQQYCDYQFTGVTQLCLNEVFLLVKGSMHVCGIELNHLPGASTLEQMKAAKTDVGTTSLKAQWQGKLECTDEEPGHLLVIPTGTSYTMCASRALVFRWCYGATAASHRQLLLPAITDLLKAFPSLTKLPYNDFKTWLADASS